MLAADGTKIGINIRHSTVVAIETPTNDFTVDPCHRRNERAFISFAQGDHDSNGKSQSRNHLLYLSKRVLGTLDSADEIPLEEETKRNDILLQHVDRGFQPLLNIFMRNGCCNRVLRKLAVLFTLLSSNHSISSIIPHRFVDDFKSILNLIRKNSNFDTNVINRVAKFSPEIRDVLFAVKNSDICSATLEFFDHLASRVKQLFSNCKEPDQINPQPGSYNPAKFGRAYYFTPHGNHLREILKYTMDKISHNSTYDDEPARAEEKCNKKYPEVGRKGTTYLFLWFDPQHYGHCYGYHMIPGHEGRKDPACSAYAYMENAPEEIFYDFSCQLEEYCLNREPGFWKNTSFFHDTFHGFSHKCPPVYKSSRLMLLKKINTEICEQTNAFLQHIKYSARAMGMAKFNHYLQFFMHQWSQKKKQNFCKKCTLAFSYVG
ncbi:hypothetical protein ACJMK2_040188 [Sinanodonta woodiana]|uniref:Uncharacterized protein n=1 Tax=Sinanodonta woodiana TaxID=1069815 RepID=A0ABD3WG83_SINWO